MGDVFQVDVREEHNGVTVASGINSTVILGPFNLAKYGAKVITLWNFGTTTMSGAIVQINPDIRGVEAGGAPLMDPNTSRPAPNAGLWENYDASTFRTLSSGTIRSLTVDPAARYKWWRVVGTVDNAGLPSTTVSGWLYAAVV